MESTDSAAAATGVGSFAEVESRGVTDEDLKNLLDAFRDDVRAHFDGTAAEIRRHFDGTAAEMRRHFDVTAAEMRRHFDATAERMERRFDGLAEAVALVDWKIDTKTAGLAEEMTRGFSDLDATIRFSHAHLVRRIERLESRS